MLNFAARVLALATLLAALAVPAQAQKVLRAVMHSDLKIIDPIWTTALISGAHGYMVYDTLFSLDDRLQPQPQMVEKWTVSPDTLSWTFTLRERLEWHDGAPVTAEDCVASLRRWGARDNLGQKLMANTAELAAIDARSFRLVLKQPYGLVLQTLAKSGSNVPFMMPKRVAATDPNTQIQDATGSGPFIFLKDQWKPGEKAVYVRNAKYKPRSEPASGLAGGKLAKVERVEWIWIPDAQTQVNALLAGEIDMIEILPADLLPLALKDANIAMEVVNRAGRQYAMRFNTLHKPFDNPKVRYAAMVALSPLEFLEANVGDPKLFRNCKSLYPCGSPLESTKGWEAVLNGNVAEARRLLGEAGYDGTPLVFLHQTDIPGHSNLATVGKAQLERAGFKVDLQAMDWQTLVSRRAKKDAPAAGGWHAFFTSWSALDVVDPAVAAFLNTACEKATFGWPCDAEMEKLRDRYAGETDPAKQRAIAEQIQIHMLGYPTHAPLGQFFTATVMRKSLSGLLTAPAIAFWNIEKK